jgi:NAD(P)-dependent dehydrogenase (short-subunit alcohol dehydrogenase family)
MDLFTSAAVEPSARGGLWGKVAVVIGGGSGVGRAVALAVARQGANVVVADFDEPRMDRTVEEVLKLGSCEAAIALSTDVRNDASVRSLARDSIKSMGRVDILVNAAGVLLQGKLEKISIHDWNWMLETNLLGAVRTTTSFLPHMTERGSGHIVNAVSFGGLMPGDPLTIPYDTGHAALAAFTEGLARRLHGSGVFVSLYCPGSKSPRIGQNTRSRGMGRWLQGPDSAEDHSHLIDPLVTGLIESLHHPRFLILGEPDEAPELQRRWDHIDAASSEIAKQETISPVK